MTKHESSALEATTFGGVLILLGCVAETFTDDLQAFQARENHNSAIFLNDLDATSNLRCKQLDACMLALQPLNHGNSSLVSLLQGTVGQLFFQRLHFLTQEFRDSCQHAHLDCPPAFIIRALFHVITPGVQEGGYPREKTGAPARRFTGVGLDMGAELDSDFLLIQQFVLDHHYPIMNVALLGEVAMRLQERPVLCRDLGTLWIGLLQELSNRSNSSNMLADAQSGKLSAEDYVLAFAAASLDFTNIVEIGKVEGLCHDHTHLFDDDSSYGARNDGLREAAERRIFVLATNRALQALERLGTLTNKDPQHPACRIYACLKLQLGTLEGNLDHIQHSIERLHLLAAHNPSLPDPSKFETPLQLLIEAYWKHAEASISFIASAGSLRAKKERAVMCSGLHSIRKSLKLLRIVTTKDPTNIAMREKYGQILRSACTCWVLAGEFGDPPAGWRNEAIRVLSAAFEVFLALYTDASRIRNGTAKEDDASGFDGSTSGSAEGFDVAHSRGGIPKYTRDSATLSATEYMFESVRVGGVLIEVLEGAVCLDPTDCSINARFTDLAHFLSSPESSPDSTHHLAAGLTAIKTFRKLLASIKKIHSKLLLLAGRNPSFQDAVSNSAWIASQLLRRCHLERLHP
ncbi:unnamed protein product [Tilletia laevis]|nr:hypothetical protein CF336_g724 [Tilletia laevis]KAE8205095.1 hypothetical protein CF328_g697 [Tilletia controversa]CAD6889176.1 unnamed protein product [Tilletia caries]KAE8208522.1 hypothetical protein CF335_g346 [Tilletia laevis]CAD6900591.1 unnamed protein product [Tilletia controversa]